MPDILILEATLELDGDLYRVSRDDSKARSVSYHVRKVRGARAGETYECRVFPDGRRHCNCKSAVCRTGGEACKHLSALEEIGAIPRVFHRERLSPAGNGVPF